MDYKKVDEKDVEYLRTLVDADRILVGDEISEDYSHDELGTVANYPEVLMRVLSTCLLYTSWLARSSPLTPQGSTLP